MVRSVYIEVIVKLYSDFVTKTFLRNKVKKEENNFNYNFFGKLEGFDGINQIYEG